MGGRKVGMMDGGKKGEGEVEDIYGRKTEWGLADRTLGSMEEGPFWREPTSVGGPPNPCRSIACVEVPLQSPLVLEVVAAEQILGNLTQEQTYVLPHFLIFRTLSFRGAELQCPRYTIYATITDGYTDSVIVLRGRLAGPNVPLGAEWAINL